MNDQLTIGYRACARLAKRHGRTYYWGTTLLPADRRRHVQAIYALCRMADDIVDVSPLDTDGKRAELVRFRGQFLAALDENPPEGSPRSHDPVLLAVADTVRRCRIDREYFDRFFSAMAMDLTTSRYPTWDDLCGYMDGSAAVIGEMMLPVLGASSPQAREPARALGVAFQLTNFLRDVAEDLDRGRIYLPQEDLARFDADIAARTVTPQWRRLMRFEIQRNRDLYAEAAPGIDLLPPASARCVATAHRLYGQILDRIEGADYDVFSGRAVVPTRTKAATAVRALTWDPRGTQHHRTRSDPEHTATAPPVAETAPWPAVRRRQPGYQDLVPTWRSAAPTRIAAALDRARRRPGEDWYVVGISGELGRTASLARTVAGQEIALWRADDGSLRAGPGACPHLGALLDDCPVLGGDLVCRWHGMRLTDRGIGAWRPHPAHDDGTLLWVQLPPTGSTSRPVTDSDHPIRFEDPIRPSPQTSITTVITRRGRCEPDDVIANRLDPWHGAWFHPYSFSHLVVDDNASSPDRLLVDVTFRLGRRLGVPVRAEFVCPSPRTIVMRIVGGEGIGSVVETHATPLTAAGAAEPATVITEVIAAQSDRPGFRAARPLGPAFRAAIRHTARRLWVDDLLYAERRYELRRRGDFPG